MLNFFLIFISSLIINYYLIKKLINLLTKFKVLDVPDNLRKKHNNPIPRGAGIALVITLIIFSAFSELILLNSYQFSIKFIPLLILISTISFFDDIKPSPIAIRLIIHFVTAILSIFLISPSNTLFGGIIPDKIDFIITVIALTAFINIFNFLDGMDGLTAIETIHLSLTILLLCLFNYHLIIHVKMVIIISTIVLSYAVAFLIFNLPPAKIFSGDIGSISSGFALGLCLLLISSSNIRLLIPCIIASLYYLFDGGITIIIRLINKEKIWQPHLKHFFQKAQAKGKPNIIILKKIATCNAFLMGIAILALWKPLLAIFLAVITVLLTISYLIK